MYLNIQDIGRRFIPPPITLERPVVKDINKNGCLSLKLWSYPTNVNIQMYELTVKLFNSGTPEEWMVFLMELKRVIVGQNIKTGPGKYLMIQPLIFGDALHCV
jgi:hypothetical protein